ncbi:MAG: polysaccharide pyruvyl transferase family protein, partial [Acutalibacteraceae bacterium]
QWNINAVTAKPLVGTILVGVGAGADEKTNSYTEKIYQKMLSHDYYHSVRDERSKQYVEQLGLKAINTGCVTMWMLTPDFCSTIPKEKASRVVFTLTGKSDLAPVDDRDQEIVDILLRNYKKIYYWIQGDHDFHYIHRLKNTENIEILPPSIRVYDSLLSEDDLDYVGTRLHGGIYAMRHRKRAIVISLDERASSINESNNLNCIAFEQVGTKLEEKINSSFATEIRMPLDKIKEWKSQFSD